MKNRCRFQEDDVTEIVPNLWLGNYKSSINKSFIKKNNIKFILRIMECDNSDIRKIRNTK